MAVGDIRTVTDRAWMAAHQRRLAGAVAGACLAVPLLLAALFQGKRFGNPFDDKVQGAIVWHLSTRVLDGLLHLTDPVPMTAALAVLAAAAALCRRWALCAVTVLSPLLALLVTEVVLKPLVHRTHQGGLAFPSGHERAPACLATILALLVLRSGWHVAAMAAAIAAL